MLWYKIYICTRSTRKMSYPCTENNAGKLNNILIMFSNKPFRSATEYAFLSNYDRYELLISGYNKQIESLTKLTIPPEIWNLIHKYYIFKLIKLIFCDTHGNIDESKYISRGVLDNITLKQLSTTIQIELFNEDTNELPDIHLWMKFNQLSASIFEIDELKAIVTQNDLSTVDPQKWTEIPNDYVIGADLTHFNDLCFAIELKTSDNKFWPTRKFKDKIEWDKIECGDFLDAMDEHGEWYESWVRYKYPKGHIFENKIVVHFIGWNIKFDATFCMSDNVNKIAPRNMFTAGPHRAKFCKEYNINIMLNENQQKQILIQPSWTPYRKSTHTFDSFEKSLKDGLKVQKKDVKLKCVSGFMPNTTEHIRFIVPYYLGNMEVMEPKSI
eukprot:151110_1